MNRTIFYRRSDNKWVYELEGNDSNTSFTLRYSSKLKVLAWFYYKISYKSDIAKCLECAIELEKDL